jgi:hypothetical protein
MLAKAGLRASFTETTTILSLNEALVWTLYATTMIPNLSTSCTLSCCITKPFSMMFSLTTPTKHQLWTSPKHLFWGHFHQNFDRNHQKLPPRHSISIPGAPQALVVGCSPAEVVLQWNFQLWCSQHRPHLILSDHHHLISPTPTPTPALPTLEASQLHQFEPFLLGFLVS